MIKQTLKVGTHRGNKRVWIEGVNVERINDFDTATSNKPIDTLEELEAFTDEEDQPEIAQFSMFNISITEFDDQAMIDDPKTEVLRMLEGITKKIKEYGLLNCDGVYLKDINGNIVGNVEVIENPDYEP